MCELTFHPAGGLMSNFERSSVIPSRITPRIINIKLILSTLISSKIKKSTYSIIYYLCLRVFFFASQDLYIEELGNN